ncbi:anthranilate synthase subunit II [Denitrobacterium detoxificans]|uniref:Anthranilate synthase component 2 n=1 Tax=Denitrobacterium detoxificans TaxID=79604 RepID=A0A172RWY3_9ACTN|nr:aminodeoxychorismate/anthranilate synthase component II [Denitrobacterium detoxificans]ANE22123.1 anthranilate synthase subunit II [Denitrobacterium detoxificans]SEO84944.1 anthranilate synthase component 2 [Denitrobacterium detoxificans]
MILLIDNYDSFSYNLFQMLGAIEPDIRVVRNDALTVEEIADLRPAGIILSPGPGRPEDAGVCVDVVRELGHSIPILGVCLGHQAIAVACGARVGYASTLMHGKQSVTAFDVACPLFADVPASAPVARYHSLSVDEDTLPHSVRVTARADDGEVMAIACQDAPVWGVQFHPESIMTPDGACMLANFIQLTKTACPQGGNHD